MSRSSGILLPVFSLPSPWGIGDMGEGADRFLSFLVRTRQRTWQVLPVTATDGGLGHSPYSAPSAFAGNPLLICPELLPDAPLCDRAHAAGMASLSQDSVSYEAAFVLKDALLREAFSRNAQRLGNELESFRKTHAAWIEDYALFRAIRHTSGGLPWWKWPEPLRTRDSQALENFRDARADEIEFVVFEQWCFDEQWRHLKERCRNAGVSILGDLPIYVMGDSADVWSHPELFDLDASLRPVRVAGVPPDYFSRDGQRWGNPVYAWERHEATGFDWWISRLSRALSLYDRVRIDHFRGLVAFWGVPRDEKTARNGSWFPVPTEVFFRRVREVFPTMPFLAENLGVITSDVTKTMNENALPGMLVLHFAFGDGIAANPYAPHNHTKANIVYTGTHDNNTTLGWFLSDSTPEERRNLSEYVGRDVTHRTVCADMVRLAMSSVADECVIPLQDILCLGADARMNTPSTRSGNWTWRFRSETLDAADSAALARMTSLFGRE
jgi:4-alpha-glucanotransferase